jgi:hypothetical protein
LSGKHAAIADDNPPKTWKAKKIGLRESKDDVARYISKWRIRSKTLAGRDGSAGYSKPTKQKH